MNQTLNRLTHPNPWKLGEPANDPSPALKGTLSPSKGERDGERGPSVDPRFMGRGLTSVPRSTLIRAHGSRVLRLNEAAARKQR